MTYDCIVVGAGAAGVTASHTLAEAGVEHPCSARDGRQRGPPAMGCVRLKLRSMNALGAVGPQEYSSRDETVELLTRRAEACRWDRHRDGRPSCSRRPARSTGDDEHEARTLVTRRPKNVRFGRPPPEPGPPPSIGRPLPDRPLPAAA
jgi:glycine/D-amino acid oxidase-like deaminating enzyme